MSIDRRVGKEHVMYLYAMEYYSATKKRNLAIRNNVDGSREYNAKQNKSVRER